MKVITEKDTNLSVAIFQDGDNVTLDELRLTATDLYEINYIYNFLNNSNANLYENVTAPDDWSPFEHWLA
jgi:hypothetical protein